MARRATVLWSATLILYFNSCLVPLASANAAEGQLATNGPSPNFTIVNGQIYTPGIAIVDAPQPESTLGGDILQVALDISGNGHLPQSDWDTATPPANDSFALYSLNVFLTSYATNLNLTVANGTDGTGLGGNVLMQERGSTVKHVDWVWPDCMVGDGGSGERESGNAQGLYNISIHQLFHYNSSNTLYYTIFNLPIHNTDAIPRNLSKPVAVPHGSSNLVTERPSCRSLSNELLKPADAYAGTTPFAGVGWIGLDEGGPVVAPGSGGYANGSNPNPPGGDGGAGMTGAGGGVSGLAGRVESGSWGMWSGWVLGFAAIVVTWSL